MIRIPDALDMLLAVKVIQWVWLCESQKNDSLRIFHRVVVTGDVPYTSLPPHLSLLTTRIIIADMDRVSRHGVTGPFNQDVHP